MLKKSILQFWTVIFGVLILAGCNTSDSSEEADTAGSEEGALTEEHEHHEEEEHDHEHDHDHHDDSQVRLTIAHESGLSILDSENYEIIESMELSVSAMSLAPDQRHIFVNNRENGLVRLLDAGVWSEPHGDHDHDYVEDPVLSTYELEGDQPTHFVNHDNQTAIFNDGSGEIQIIDNATLSTEEEIIPAYTVQTVPHHGVAVPLSEGNALVSYTPEDDPQPLPEGIVLVNADGEEEARYANCPGLHGEASGGSGDTETVAFGCEGQVLLYHPAEKEVTELVLPDEGARVGSLKGLKSSNYLIGNYSSVDDEALNAHISIINLQDRTIQTVDLGTEYTGAMTIDEEHAYVLGKDGTLYVINLTDGAIESEIPVIDPIAPAEGHGHGAPSPALALINGTVFLTDPVTMTLSKIDPAHNETEVVTTFESAPISLIAIQKGEPHDH